MNPKVTPSTETTLQTNYNVAWITKNNYAARIINTYWARGSKISWFFKVSPINCLPKPKVLRDKSRYFAITEFHSCFIIRSLFFWSTKDVKSLAHSSGDRLASHADVHVGEERTSAWEARERSARHFSHKSVVSVTHEQNIIYCKTLVYRQIFTGHVVGSRPMKRKEKFLDW